jgi:hypothetical protein
MKDFVINGVLHAHYEIEGETVFLKTCPNYVSNTLKKESINDYEQLLTEVISLIEKVKITKIAYLNV